MKHALEETNTVQIAVDQWQMLVINFDEKAICVFGDGDGRMCDGILYNLKLDSP
jgi:hypothetical protein